MGEPSYTIDGRQLAGTNTPEKSAGDVRAKNPPELRLTVVENDDSPDRGTIYPPDLTGLERMETWVSVDMSMVIDLSTWR